MAYGHTDLFGTWWNTDPEQMTPEEILTDARQIAKAHVDEEMPLIVALAHGEMPNSAALLEEILEIAQRGDSDDIWFLHDLVAQGWVTEAIAKIKDFN